MFDEKYLKEQMKNLNIQLELLKQRQEYSDGFFALSQSQLYPNNSMNYIPDYQNPLIVPDTSNPINTDNEMEAGALLTKLMNIMDSNQAEDVINNLEDSEISTLNTFFTDFTNTIKKKEVKFKSSEQIIDFIKLYVSKNSYTNLQTSYPNPGPKEIVNEKEKKEKKDKKVDNPELPEAIDLSLLDSINKLNYYLFNTNLSTNESRKSFLKQYIVILKSNIKAGQNNEQDDLDAITTYINDTNKSLPKLNSNESLKVLHQLMAYLDSKNQPGEKADIGTSAPVNPQPVTKPVKKTKKDKDINALNQYILTNTNLDNSHEERKKVLKHYNKLLVSELDERKANEKHIMNSNDNESLELLKNLRDYIKNNSATGNGFRFKTQRRKIGSGSSVDFEKNKIYLDMAKLNDNIMSIKYRKTGNKIMDEIPINHVVRNVILDICMKQFDKKKYEKLSIEEKKVVIFFNTKFQLEEINEANPISLMYDEYKLLIGQLEAGNDSSLIKKRIKQILFELVKYKKISSSHMRNIVFQLDNSD